MKVYQTTILPILILASTSLPGCGSREPELSEHKVFQGSEDQEHASVGLLLRNGKLWCSASLIGPQRALSAGHCFEGKSEIPPQLLLSLKDGEKLVKVTEVVVHPQYSDWFGRVTHDVAVLKLEEAVDLPLIALAEKPPEVGKSITFVGYGYIDALDKASMDGTRRQGSNIVGDVDKWKLFFPEPGSTGSQACIGDSGGPVLAEVDGRSFQVGIVSGSTDAKAKKTCQVDTYAARVDAHRTWILAQ